jgi:hypothetical protein
LTVAVLFLWGAHSDDRTGLSFVYAAGPRQRSLSRVRVPWISRPYFTVPVLRLPFSSPPTTRRVTVEVFDPATTRAELHMLLHECIHNIYKVGPQHRKHIRCLAMVICEQRRKRLLRHWFYCCIYSAVFRLLPAYSLLQECVYRFVA